MKKHLLKSLLALALVLINGSAWGETKTVTYTVTSTSAVEITGDVPIGSSAVYTSTYTSKCQLTSGNSMTLTLKGFDGCKVTGVTLSMKSNKSSGSGSFSLTAGGTTLASINDSQFSSSDWYGEWSTDYYVNVVPTMSNSNYTIGSNESVVLTIAASANSLYCQSMTITYEEVAVIKPDYDILDHSVVGVTGSSYATWENDVFGNYSGVLYAGQSAGGNSSIQLRAESPSGIVTKSFYGRATKIVVEWNSNTTSGRTIDIYGKSTAYSSAGDLYDTSARGTKLGSIVCGESTELEIANEATSDFIGIRSKANALYINEIKIYWEQKKKTITVSPYEWATASFSERVVVPTDGTVYKVNGATDGSLNLVEVPEGDVIGWNVGVLLYKAGGGDIEFVITGSDATVLGTDTDNKLSATGDITTADYILGTYDGGFGFCHPSKAMTCTSGKAFLPAKAVTGASAPFLRIGGASNMANVESYMEINVYYDLMGRKVEQPERGIYILNGKKVIVQ